MKQREEVAIAALRVSGERSALGNERFDADGATFIRNRRTPGIQDANHVDHVTASTPEEIDRLLQRTEREFKGYDYRRFDVDFTTPPAFEARLMLEGYSRGEYLLMVLEGDLAGEAKTHDISPVDDESGWEALDILREEDWREWAARVGGYDDSTTPQWDLLNRAKSPPVRYWMAYVDGEPAAYLTSWSGFGGIGQVEDMFTSAKFRHRGLATALIHRCVADCRDKRAGPVIIIAEADDTPKRMYAAMGFRPLVVLREYLKKITV